MIHIPKDLIEDVEIQTGGSYDYFDNDLMDVYKDALIDTYELLITIKLNINDILNNPKKYVINEETKKMLLELLNHQNKKKKE